MIEYIVLLPAAVGLVLCLLQLVAVRMALREKAPEPSLPFPPISVLKPLKGIDDGLMDNLESFCVQDYPEYEVILALRDKTDPAVKIAQKIRDKYPDKVRIVNERCEEGLNPKVNNLIPAYKTARHPFFLISDSNVSVGPDYLRSIIVHMNDPKVALVSNIIRGVEGKTLGSILDNLHLNTFIAGSVCVLEKIAKIPCVVGKSMLIRKETFDRLGGFDCVKDHLAEDFVLGEKMSKAGMKVVLSNYMVDSVNEYWAVRQFISRHTRWGKLRWKIGGPKYFLELLGNPVFLSLIPAIALGPSKFTIGFAVLVSALKTTVDMAVGMTLNSGMNPSQFLLVPLKDIMIGFVWFVPIFDNTVNWRGDSYIVTKGSVLKAYERGRFSYLTAPLRRLFDIA
jgi:ceramide glucosyltransferase